MPYFVEEMHRSLRTLAERSSEARTTGLEARRRKEDREFIFEPIWRIVQRENLVLNLLIKLYS